MRTPPKPSSFDSVTAVWSRAWIIWLPARLRWIEEWQFDYNWRRSHGGLSGKTPAGRLAELAEKTPLREEVALAYEANKERLRFSNWAIDQAVAGFAKHARS